MGSVSAEPEPVRILRTLQWKKTRLTAVCGKNGHIANYTGTHIVLTRNMVLYREFVTSKQGVLLKNTSPTATYQE